MISLRKAYIFFLEVYFLALPLSAMNIGAFGSVLKILAIIPVAIAAINLKGFVFAKNLFLYFLYFVVAAFSKVYSVNASSSATATTSIFLLFVLMASTCCFKYSAEEIEKIKFILHLSSLLSAVVCLVFGKYSFGRLLLDVGNLREDPNYFCMYLSFGLIFSLEKLLSKERDLKKIFYLLEIVIYFTVCFLTGSRGGLIALIIGALTFIIFQGDKIFSTKKTVLLLFAIGVAFIIMNSISEILTERFSFAAIVESGRTGRFEIWENAVSIFKDSSIFRKLFGYGINSTRTVFAINRASIINVMHNMFLESLIELGILGLVIYATMVFSFVKSALNFKDKFALGVIICMVVMSLSTSISTFKPYINSMMYIMCCQFPNVNEE